MPERADLPPARDAAPASARIMIVDDDPVFLGVFAANLTGAGYRVDSFTDPAALIAAVAAGATPEALVLDWHMPGMSGLEVMNRLRERGLEVPILFLTSLGQPIFEELALDQGAIDFIDKARSPAVILKRLALALSRGAPSPAPLTGGDTIKLGRLTLRPESKRASWDDQEISLSISEFEVVALLADKAGIDVSYREIYDVVRGSGFVAGQGDEGYRANVRAMVKRIRRKFCETDPGFDALENYAGFGYRWRAGA